MPVKNIAAELVDSLSSEAKIVGTCNTFVNKDGQKEKLAKETPNVHVEVMDLADDKALKEAIEKADLLINTTSVGMAPNNDSLVDKAYLRKNLVVADAVYHPEKTTLILDAEAIGCKAVGGKGMLLQQGVANYKLFVDGEFPTEEFQKFNK